MPENKGRFTRGLHPLVGAGIAKDRYARNPRREFFQQLQPFGTRAVIQRMKPVVLLPGRARLATKPAPTGSTTPINTIGIVLVSCWSAATAGLLWASMT